MSRIRTLAACMTIFLFASILAACGGGGSSGSNPDTGLIPEDTTPSVFTIFSSLNNSTSATLYASVNANGSPTDAWFEWGTDPNLLTYNSTARQNIGTAITRVTVTASIIGLSLGTTYYFRVVGENSKGAPSRGAILCFNKNLSGFIKTYGISANAWKTSDGGHVICGTEPGYYRDGWLIKEDAGGKHIWGKVWRLTGPGGVVQQTSDGGYAIIGTRERPFATLMHDIYLRRTDSSGNVLWDKTYAGSGDRFTAGGQQTLDGGFIIAGLEGSPSIIPNKVIIIKTDSNGKLIRTNLSDGEFGFAPRATVQQTPDGGYVIAKLIGVSSWYLMRIDSGFNYIWEKSLASYTYSKNHVQQTKDGGFVIAEGGSSLLRLGAGTEFNWRKSLFFGSYEFVNQTSDGGYILTGSTYSAQNNNDLYLGKTDAGGNALWTKAYGEVRYDHGITVQQTMDGGYLISGIASSFGTANAFCLIKTDGSGATVLPYISPPMLFTDSAAMIGYNSVTLIGNVNPNSQSTSVWFEWGTSTYNNTTEQIIGSGTTFQSCQVPISGLLPGTTYYYRVVASNLSGTTRGTTLAFTTLTNP